MITGKDLGKKLEIENYIDEYTSLYFGTLSKENFQYLDEIYTNIRSKIGNLSEIGNVPVKIIKEDEFIKEKDFSDFISKYRETSEISYRMVPEIYDSLQSLSDNIFNISSEVNEIIYNCRASLSAVEEETKREATKTSVKSENIIYDNLSNQKIMIEGNLNLNEQGRYMTLPVKGFVEVPYIVSMECNKPKGEYEYSDYQDRTMDSITNGYFHSRMFSENPKLEDITIDGDIYRMNDGDPETSYIVEYNSFTARDNLVVSFKLLFDQSRIDNIDILFEPLATDSVIGSSGSYPALTLLHVENNIGDPDDRFSESMHNMVLDKRISMEGNIVGNYEGGITYSGKQQYPSASYMINTKPANSIILEYTVNNPQEIYYPEKHIYDYRDIKTHQFNYFETLVNNGYIVPADKKSTNPDFPLDTDPYSYYDQSEFYDMSEILRKAYKTKDEKMRMFRYMVGIKELVLRKQVYETKGTIITSNLKNEDGQVASVQLYVNEIVPDQTKIDYYISHNKSTWIKIIPENRTTLGNTGKRIVFRGFSSKPGDILSNDEGTALFMKIEMSGTDEVTPILKSYSLKVKYI